MHMDRVAVVTGGSRGIGRGIVEALARSRWSVVVNYRSDADAAESTRRSALSLGAPRAIGVRADVADLDAGRRLVDETLETFGRIDLLVNNAGVAPRTRLDLLDADPEEFDRLLAINLRGPYFLTQTVARRMVELVESGRVVDPQIHFITSVSAEFASINRGEYCVSKAGLSMAVKLFATRLAKAGIRVFEIRPGVIATDMTESVKAIYDRRLAEGLAPIERWGRPEDVGAAVVSLASGGIPYATGNVIEVDGGLHLRRL
ncbi:MAG: 3-ketoacyl-ACP reductase [Isosphaeraceae bacterium]|nr:3-ketoacyl-ACP reductase [Isosphaeraceae bacterium]